MRFICIHLLVLCTGFYIAAHTQGCSTAGPFAAGAVTNNTSIGSFGWSNLANAGLSDNNYSSAGTLIGVLSSANSNLMVFKNFGFALPAAAVICGIEVTREGSASGILIGSSVRDNGVRIIKNSIIAGTNQANAVNWSGTDGNVVYGSTTDDWELGWTAADINSADFGGAVSVRLAAGLASLFLSAHIDQVRVTVYYNLVLPVTLESFSAKAAGDKVEVNWVTTSEFNNEYFLVQRPVDGRQWKVINTVKAVGNSNGKQYYEAIDEKPYAVNYYRLEQRDDDGKSHFSKTVLVKMEDKKDVLVYPNPAHRQLFVRHNGKLESVQLTDMNGKMVTINPGKPELPVLPPGLYSLRLVIDNEISYHRIILK